MGVMNQMYNLKTMSLSTEIFISICILQLTFYSIVTRYLKKRQVILQEQVFYVGSLVLWLTTLLILNEDLFAINLLSNNNSIINDYLSFISKFMICIASFLFVLLIKISPKDELIKNNLEYVILILASVLGSLLLCSSNDLITAYLSIELQSVAFYVMAAFKKNSCYSIESGLKYFIIGSLSSAFFLFGSSLLYGCFGSINFNDFRAELSLLVLGIDLKNQSNIEDLSYFSTLWFTGVRKAVFITFLECCSGIAIVGLSESCLASWVSEKYLDYHVKKDFSCLLYNSTNEKKLSLTNYAYIFYSDKNADIIVFEYVRKFLNYYTLLQNGFKATMYPAFYKYSSDDFLFYSTSKCFFEATSFLSGYDKTCPFKPKYDTDMLNSSLDLISLGGGLICLSIFIKLAVAPFHYWSLDVYEGSPNSTTAFFAIISKIGLLVLMIRLFYSSLNYVVYCNYKSYIFFFAVLSIFVGSIGGLEQRKLKTLMAYSSVSHTGYLLLAFSTNNSEGMVMMLYYLTIYVIAGVCFWSVYLFIRPKRSFYFNKNNKELGDFVLLKNSNPTLAFVLMLTIFSIAGIPPLVGFLAKIGIFLVLIKSSAYLISLLSILFSVISTFYYVRIIKILYFENTLVGKLYHPISTKKSLFIAVLSLLLILLCLNPMILYLTFHKVILMLSF